MKQGDKIFFACLKQQGIPLPTTEHKFHEGRKWRMDYAWIDNKIALEVEGGVWTGGRHTRGQGFINDCEKYSEAAIAGWCVIRVTPQQLTDLNTMNMLKRAFKNRGEKI